jgi:hypothetical protein
MLKRAISSIYAIIMAFFLAACTIEPPVSSSESVSAPAQRPEGSQTCPAGKEWELPVGQDLRIRFIEVRRLSETQSNFLSIVACIDAIYPMAGSIDAGVFNPHGRLLLTAGQPVGLPQGASGTSYTYTFETEWQRIDAEAMRGPYANRVLLQMPFGQPASDGKLQHQTTISILKQARFIGLTARPFGRIEPDSCLAPPGDRPTVRDPKMILFAASGKGTLMMNGCVVGRRMSAASLLYRPLLGVVDQRRDDPMFKPLTEFLSDGDTQRLLSPVRGLHGPRMIALLAGQRLATEPVYDLVPLEVKGFGCAEPAGQVCTPNNDPSISVVGVRLRRWPPAAANPNAGGE